MAAPKRRSRNDLDGGESGMVIGLQPPSLKTRDMINAFKRSLKRDHRGVATALGSLLIDIPVAAEALHGLAEYLTDAVTVAHHDQRRPLLWHCLHKAILAYDEGAIDQGDRFGAFLDILAGTAAAALQAWTFIDAEGRQWRAGDAQPLGRWLVASQGPYELRKDDGRDSADAHSAIHAFITPECWRGHNGSGQKPILGGLGDVVVPAG